MKGIATDDEKIFHYDNSKRRKSWEPRGHLETSTAKLNIHGKTHLASINVVYFAFLRLNETITSVVWY